MDANFTPQPVDYLVIGHATKDVHNGSYSLGGTVAYSGLTAQAIGMKVGIVTACDPEYPLDELGDIQRVILPSGTTTTFRNQQTENGRRQWQLERAEPIQIDHIPDAWRTSEIIHLAPVANEVDHVIIQSLKAKFLCVTAQGWLRSTDGTDQVIVSNWRDADKILGCASATVIGIEDVGGDEKRIEEYAHLAQLLVVTEGSNGARIYWNGDLRRFTAPIKKENDPTGAGDIFASAFFIRLYQTQNPWEAARYATILASNSVTRPGLAGVPTPAEAQNARIEVLEKV